MTSPKPFARSVLGRIKASYPRIQHLLVPLDFSGKSRQALRYAVPIAQKFSAKIRLVHVLPAPEKAVAGELPRLRQEAAKRLGRMATELLPPGVRGENAVLVGKPAEQILAFVEKHDVDLIVLTTNGRSGLRRVLVGSTAEHIMREARCPVMSIRRR